MIIKKLILFLLFILYIFSFHISTAEDFLPFKRLNMDQGCFDFADAIPIEIESKLNRESSELKSYFDIDLIIIAFSGMQKYDINKLAADTFSSFMIGSQTKGDKGILFLVDMKNQKIKKSKSRLVMILKRFSQMLILAK